MKLNVPDETATLIRHWHPDLKRRIREALRTIVEDPTSGKPPVDELRGLRSFRLGKVRIVYAINEGDYIEIVAVGPRKRIYEETYRLISRK